MSTPTLYFPDVPYKIGFSHGRRWKTDATPEGPTGRIQRFKNWTSPKRRLKATMLGLDGSTVTVSETTYEEVRDFLNLIAGRFTRFYIFDPKQENYDQDAALPVQVTLDGLFDTTFPMVCPFKNGTVTGVYDDGVLTYTAGNFTQDAGGPGGETRITTVVGSLPADGSVITVDVLLANQRIPVCSLTDLDDFAFDWTAADPPTEIALDLEEDFG
jgi:hypothetical protein